MSANRIADLGRIDWSKLPALTTLDLRGNLIANITSLAALTSVADLDLSYNQITNATPLAGLHGLRAIGIRNNKLTKHPAAGRQQRNRHRRRRQHPAELSQRERP